MNIDTKSLHDAIIKIPHDHPYIQPLSLALSILSKGDPIRDTLAEKVTMCIKLIELEGANNGQN